MALGVGAIAKVRLYKWVKFLQGMVNNHVEIFFAYAVTLSPIPSLYNDYSWFHKF